MHPDKHNYEQQSTYLAGKRLRFGYKRAKFAEVACVFAFGLLKCHLPEQTTRGQWGHSDSE